MDRVNVTPAASTHGSTVAARIDNSVPLRSISVARIMSAVMELPTINLLKEVGFRPRLRSREGASAPYLNRKPVPQQRVLIANAGPVCYILFHFEKIMLVSRAPLCSYEGAFTSDTLWHNCKSSAGNVRHIQEASIISISKSSTLGHKGTCCCGCQCGAAV